MFKILILIMLLASSVQAELKELKILGKGRSSIIEWALYLAPQGNDESNIILIIKNTGAKFIDLDTVGTKHFSVNKFGKPVKILRISGFENIAYQSVIVGKIVLDGKIILDENTSFEMKSVKSAVVPVKISPFKISLLRK